MEKLISLRPTNQIMVLFDEIKEFDTHPEMDRGAIFNRALKLAPADEDDWKALASVKRIRKYVPDIERPDHIRFKVDGKLYQAAADQIQQTFSLQRVTAPYIVRLILTNYLLKIQNSTSSEAIKVVEKMIDFGIDVLVFKKEYDTSDSQNKKELFNVCREYLERNNLHMNESIRKQVNQRIKAYSDYFNVNRYFPTRRSTLGTCNIIFVSKVLAGLLLIVSEIESYNLDEIIDTMRQKEL